MIPIPTLTLILIPTPLNQCLIRLSFSFAAARYFDIRFLYSVYIWLKKLLPCMNSSQTVDQVVSAFKRWDHFVIT